MRTGPDGEQQLLYMNPNRDTVDTTILSYEPGPDGSMLTPSESLQLSHHAVMIFGAQVTPAWQQTGGQHILTRIFSVFELLLCTF